MKINYNIRIMYFELLQFSREKEIIVLFSKIALKQHKWWHFDNYVNLVISKKQAPFVT